MREEECIHKNKDIVDNNSNDKTVFDFIHESDIMQQDIHIKILDILNEL